MAFVVNTQQETKHEIIEPWQVTEDCVRVVCALLLQMSLTQTKNLVHVFFEAVSEIG